LDLWDGTFLMSSHQMILLSVEDNYYYSLLVTKISLIKYLILFVLRLIMEEELLMIKMSYLLRLFFRTILDQRYFKTIINLFLTQRYTLSPMRLLKETILFLFQLFQLILLQLPFVFMTMLK
jgi:hypothetical protein